MGCEDGCGEDGREVGVRRGGVTLPSAFRKNENYPLCRQRWRVVKKKFRNFPGLFSWTSFRLFRQGRRGLDATAGKVTEVEEGPELF